MAAAPHLPPITRESLKELYSKNPCPPLPQELLDQLPKLVAFLDDRKKALGGTLPARVTRDEEPPKRIDENMWRIREEAEITQELLPKLREGADAATTAAVSAALAAVTQVATEVTNYQQTLVAETLKRVESFLPQDFRLSVIRYTKERKEAGFKAEVDELVKAGGSVEAKYKLLWAQQMQARLLLLTPALSTQRREALVQLSNASGMWKTLISYVAGCPPELLDFLKQFNDPAGPMEEFRLAYGPNVYFMTRLIGRLRAVAALAAALPAATKDVAGLLQSTSEGLAREVRTMMAFLLVVNIKKSPFFVDAEEDTDAAKEVTVAAWGVFEKHRPVHKGVKIAWEFSTKAGDIAFAVAFTSSSSVVEVLASKRYNAQTEAGEHTAPADGTYQFKWDNSYSWTTSKALTYRLRMLGGPTPPASPATPPPHSP